MDWGERLSSDDEAGRLEVLRALRDLGPDASPWLSSLLDHMGRVEIESHEWGATWRAAARVAATDTGARAIRERLSRAERDVEIRALLMVVMNLPQDLWPSGDELLLLGRSGEPTTRGIALQLAVSALPASRVLGPILDACSSADVTLRMRGYQALVGLLDSDAGVLGDPWALAALGHAAARGTEEIRLEVVQRLASPPLSPGVEEILAEALGDPKGGIRGKAARALLSSRRHRDAAIRALAGLIAGEEQSEATRCDAIDELPAEAARVPEIAAALRVALRDRSANLRSSAEDALAGVDDAKEDGA